MLIEPLELAYLAGFFDGEGTVGIKRLGGRHRHLHKPYACVSQVRPEVLLRLKELCGGNIHFNSTGSKNGVWCWQSSGVRHTLQFLEALLPYLRIKKAEAEIVIGAFQQLTKNRRAGIPAALSEARETAMRVVQGMR